MKRMFLLYAGLICALLAMADDNAVLWVGESHTFSVAITNDSASYRVVHWEDMYWEYESETDSEYYTIDASESTSTDAQATATVTLTDFFSEAKYVVFHYTEVIKVKVITWVETRKEHTKKFKITCNKVGITMNPSSISLPEGEKQYLQWEFSPMPPAGAPMPTVVSFVSNKEAVATVDANGCVTGKSVGKATITAKTNYATSATCVVNVTAVLATSISIVPHSAVIVLGSSIQLQAILPENTSNKKVTWSSSNKNVATVDANGLVTAVKQGEAIITAKTADGSNLSAQCSVKVVQGDVNGDGAMDIKDVGDLIDIVLGNIKFD